MVASYHNDTTTMMKGKADYPRFRDFRRFRPVAGTAAAVFLTRRLGGGGSSTLGLSTSGSRFTGLSTVT